METPDPTPGALKQVLLTPHDILWGVRVFQKGATSAEILPGVQPYLGTHWIPSLWVGCFGWAMRYSCGYYRCRIFDIDIQVYLKPETKLNQQKIKIIHQNISKIQNMKLHP